MYSQDSENKIILGDVPFIYTHIDSSFINDALAEDIGRGDLSSQLIAANRQAEMIFVAKDSMVLSGTMIAIAVFKHLSDDVTIKRFHKDGQEIIDGTQILKISGNARMLLQAERVALNLMQHLSGIATLTNEYVRVANGKVAILDTRKTLPAYRILAKYAVRCGGGINHRLRLDDGLMIKDNHILLMGGITKAIRMAKIYLPALTKIEIECDSLEQVAEVVAEGVDVIMLDNMKTEQIAEAVTIIRSSSNANIYIEASGGMNLRKLAKIAKLPDNQRPDAVSIGAITHSAPAVDISAEINFKV